MSELHRITVSPEQCAGRPCIRGMRIRVKDVLDLLAAGGKSRGDTGGLPVPGIRRHHGGAGIRGDVDGSPCALEERRCSEMRR